MLKALKDAFHITILPARGARSILLLYELGSNEAVSEWHELLLKQPFLRGDSVSLRPQDFY